MTPPRAKSGRLAAMVAAAPTTWSVGHIIRFGLVGLLATCAHFAVSLSTSKLFGLAPVLANATGFVVALALSFAGHSFFTFRVPATTGAGARFVVVNLAAVSLSSALIVLLKHNTNLDGAVILAAAALFTAGSSFVGHSLWSFGRPG